VKDTNLLDERSGDQPTNNAVTAPASTDGPTATEPSGPVDGNGDHAAGPASSNGTPAARPARRRASRPVGADPESAPPVTTAGGSLSTKLLPELQQIAAGLGIAGVARLRKGQIITAIQEARGGGGAADARREPNERPATTASVDSADRTGRVDRVVRDRPDRTDRTERPDRDQTEQRPDRDQTEQRPDRDQTGQRPDRDQTGQRPDRDQGGQRPDRVAPDRGGNQGQGERNNAGNQTQRDDEDGEARRGRRGRYRDRRRNRDRQGAPSGAQDGFTDREPQVKEDDVLAPVAGILDTSDNYAFLRTSGYLAGPTDVYVSMNLVRRHGLRRGDALTGVVKANASENEHQGNRKEKYNPLVRLDTVNGLPADEAKARPEFHKLVPLYPQERLRLETESSAITTRVIDLVMPIGKGQRALIVSPPKAGKTMVLQAIANAITVNNPECHLMVVLVDERPEEVTDMQRSVKGEVIASTFDRPATDHTIVAELSIERAKRLVELGHDVVVLLDSITRLGRAYNLAAPASGRILSGGVDSTALYPPKRFLGAARNIEDGGSLTILATALVETGSTMDTVIFEEFKGTGNAELKLDRKIADKRVFPAVDIDPSSTRKEDLLMSAEEMAIVHKLRRVLHALDSQQAIELLISKLKVTRTNIEFLMQIAKTAPGE